jgi:hypothetical protein
MCTEEGNNLYCLKIQKLLEKIGYPHWFLAHSSTRKQPILEGDMPFESPKCPLKSGFIIFLKIKKKL